METENNIYESELYQELDLADFSMWLDRNINLILNKKQTKISFLVFFKMNTAGTVNKEIQNKLKE